MTIATFPILTFDIDWASDAVIELVADRLISHKVKSTWFVTHECTSLRKLRQFPELFELGLHPNFLPGTTHGNSIDEILTRVAAIAPAARALRSHSLFSSSRLLVQLIERGNIDIESSLYLRHANPAPVTEFWHEGRSIRRVPIVWEDDLEAMHPAPIWSLQRISDGRSEPFVLAFHPLHLATNDPTPSTYNRMKAAHPDLKKISIDDLQPYHNPGDGPLTMFNEALEFLSEFDGGLTLSQYVDAIVRVQTGSIVNA